jgi:hypothetical protein
VDLGTYLRVAWRFRVLLASGLVLATVFALAAFIRIELSGGLPSVSYREDSVYSSRSTLLVTQKGFPWGRAILDDMVRIENEGGEPAMVPRFADGTRYSGLAALYAELAEGDAVAREVMKASQPGQTYSAEVAREEQTGAAMPLIHITGLGRSPEAARQVAQRAVDAFQDYLAAQQRESNISADRRIEVVVSARPTAATVFAPRSPVKPILLFLVVMSVFVAIAFALENLRPAPRAAPVIEPVSVERVERDPAAAA